MLQQPHFAPMRPQGVPTGSTTLPGQQQPNFLGDLFHLGTGLVTGDWSGLIGSAFGVGGGSGTQGVSTPPIASPLPMTAPDDAGDSGSLTKDPAELAAAGMIPEVGQPLNQMDPENTIGVVDDVAQAPQPPPALGGVPYINPFSWELM